MHIINNFIKNQSSDQIFQYDQHNRNKRQQQQYDQYKFYNPGFNQIRFSQFQQQFRFYQKKFNFNNSSFRARIDTV